MVKPSLKSWVGALPGNEVGDTLRRRNGQHSAQALGPLVSGCIGPGPRSTPSHCPLIQSLRRTMIFKLLQTDLPGIKASHAASVSGDGRSKSSECSVKVIVVSGTIKFLHESHFLQPIASGMLTCGGKFLDTGDSLSPSVVEDQKPNNSEHKPTD